MLDADAATEHRHLSTANMKSGRNLSYQLSRVLPSFSSSSLCCCSNYCLSRISRNSGYRTSILERIVSCLTSANVPVCSIRCQQTLISSVCSFSTMNATILVQARDPAKLSLDIQNAIEEQQFAEAWRLHKQHMQMEGFPLKSVVNQLITGFSETLDPQWLEKAYGLVELAFEENKQSLFEKETLIYLAYTLARSALPVQAASVLRMLVRIEQYFPVTAWTAVLVHMSQSGPGAYLAAEMVLEIGYLFQDNRVDPRKKSNGALIAMKPDALAFSIALSGCVLFRTTRKAEQLLEMMPRVGIKTDAMLLTIMAHVYEKNGRIEDLKRLKRHIEEALDLTDAQYRQYHNCLLTCHLKLGDLDTVSRMVLEMLRKRREARNSLAAANLILGSSNRVAMPSARSVSESRGSVDKEKSRNPKSSLVSFQDFLRDRKCARLEAETTEVLNVLLGKLEEQVEMITTKHGILQPIETAYVKLSKSFLEAGKTKDLAEFLIKVEKEDSPVSADESALAHVINSCISAGWLEQAHDLLDEIRFSGIIPSSSLYSSLLKAYCKTNQTVALASLLREVRKAGIQLDSSCYESLIQLKVVNKDTEGALHLFKEMKEAKIPRSGHQEFELLVQGCAESRQTGMMSKLLEEIKDGQREECGVHDWNNVIHFFCKKRLMQDADKALKKMRSLGHNPNAQTFHSLVTGYAAIGGKYQEVTELWAEMKSLASSMTMKFDQELLDSVLYTFVRGGFFARANEVVEMMEKGKMFVDKYKYRTLFLKYHKTMYKGKAPKFQTESLSRKREAALAFKKWVKLLSDSAWRKRQASQPARLLETQALKTN
ncbi:hypothetical protein V2J09_022091 [Rumex salicifolius]